MPKRFVIPFLFLAFCAFTTCGAYAQKLYMFTGGDFRDEDVGNAVWMGDGQVDGTFEMYMPSKYLVRYNKPSNDEGESGTEWSGPNIEDSENVHDDILDAIERCPAGEDDTIFFYWCGHGARDENDEHYLFMPEGRGRSTMYRSEILDALQRKNPRLVVFITDSCHTYFNPVAFSAAPGTRLRFLATEGVPQLYANLFFQYKGVLDMNSSSPDQRSEIMDPTKMINGNGTVFSCAFSDIMDNKRVQLYGWKELVSQINATVRSWNFKQSCYVWT
ncbi:MAG: caspase family protein, partial [Thermoguttaceae bacterium]|nr:caspase family protein [Thermoguttaceae bacterium]